MKSESNELNSNGIHLTHTSYHFYQMKLIIKFIMTKITNNALLNFLMIRTQIYILNLYKLWLVPVFGSLNTVQQAKLLIR